MPDNKGGRGSNLSEEERSRGGQHSHDSGNQGGNQGGSNRGGNQGEHRDGSGNFAEDRGRASEAGRKGGSK